jgi:hypothetical protein
MNPATYEIRVPEVHPPGSLDDIELPRPMYEGLARLLIGMSSAPDLVIRLLNKESGTFDAWPVVRFHLPPSKQQTYVVEVEGRDGNDYFQLPYCEAVPRLRYNFRTWPDDSDTVPVVTQVNNSQQREWLEDMDVAAWSRENYETWASQDADLQLYDEACRFGMPATD